MLYIFANFAEIAKILTLAAKYSSRLDIISLVYSYLCTLKSIREK